MNELLQTELTKIVTNINNGTESAWDFLSQQTPDIIQQMMLWYGVYNAILMVIGTITLAAILYFNYRQLKWLIDEDTDWQDHPQLIFNLLQLFWVILLDETLNFQWLKVWIAPKVWLLEHISEMIK